MRFRISRSEKRKRRKTVLPRFRPNRNIKPFAQMAIKRTNETKIAYYMAFSKLRSALFIILLPIISFGQTKDTPPANWFNLDYERDGVMGISTEKAYEQLLNGKESTTVVVAVIDAGVDVNHEDLKDVIWINEKDSAATGTDEDGNGYINDKYGWNFIGNANGENVHYDNLEVTRLIRELEPQYISVLPSTP